MEEALPSDPDTESSGLARPPPNLRITLWGVQGSCPIFPTSDEIRAYARRVAVYTVEKALADLARRADQGNCGADLLRSLAAPEAAAAYQETLGLPDLPVYGGETTCVQVETAEGNILLLDLGTGLRECSNRLLKRWKGLERREIFVFGSHQHLDHRMGLTFSSLCYERERPFTLRMHGTHEFLRALDERYGMFSHTLHPTTHLDDPLDWRMMSATFIGTELRREGAAADGSTPPWDVKPLSEPVAIGATRVTAFEVYHGPTQCLAYKVTHGGSSFVFCTDHELRHGDDAGDPRQVRSQAAEEELLRQCHGATAAYFDGQYFLEEYLGRKAIGASPAMSRIDWGHGCVEDAVRRAMQCRISRTLIGHHDPERQWDRRVESDQRLLRDSLAAGLRVELAKAGDVIELA